jgi:16S rRNA (guanine527-N7)-methyltransferase
VSALATPRLTELAARYELPDTAVPAFEELLRLVAEDDTAPTTIRDPAAGVDAHIADSLAGLEIDALRSAQRIADLGSGPGFPGLVLAAALPASQVALVESAGRKCVFLETAIERAEIVNADVVCARVEEWRDGLGTCDAVTVRAVAPLNVLAEYAAPLLKIGGHLVAWKGVRNPAEEADGAAAAEQLGLEPVEIRRVDPFPGADNRHLYLYSKVRDTPAKYPRRPGMARKRPLSTKA